MPITVVQDVRSALALNSDQVFARIQLHVLDDKQVDA